MESPKTVSTKQQRIARLARIHPEVSFTSMSYYIDTEFLREAYKRTRKDGASGIDDQTSEDYKRELEQNLESLHERFKSGRYKAPPVRRVYIPKGKGKEKRPIGIPSFEDKVLQRAVHMVLEPLFEQDFLDCSYGFRPGRSAHDAVLCFKSRRDALRVLKVLGKRLGKYGLSMNEEKTKLVEFRRPVTNRDNEKRTTFNFLGFTHYWGKSRKGRPTIKRKTEKSKLNRSLRVI